MSSGGKLYDLTKKKPKAIIASIELPGCSDDLEASVEELVLLLSNLDIKTLATTVQNRQIPDPAFFIGSGKAMEIKGFAGDLGATLLVVNDFLTPTQKSNLQKLTGLEVWDRTFVIMKIFESRAHTAEAKLQVEMAQYHYEIPSLKGLGYQMSRTGGGIGTRGPGETEFERHRRKLDKRIKSITQKLEEVRKRRKDRRERRRHNGIPLVSLVGYTNSGKSTLLKALSGDEEILSANQLFSTLDTVVRKIKYRNSLGGFLLSDTVGFIRKLPPELVAAFRATLEEVAGADLLIIVLDATDKDPVNTFDIVLDTLRGLEADTLPRITVLNKIDKLDYDPSYTAVELRSRGEQVVFTSAIEHRGFDEFLEAVSERLSERVFSYEWSPVNKYEDYSEFQ